MAIRAQKAVSHLIQPRIEKATLKAQTLRDIHRQSQGLVSKT